MKSKIGTTIFILASVLLPTSLVLWQQKANRQRKIAQDVLYLKQLQEEYSLASSQILKDIKTQKTENLKTMEAAKVAYEELLANQPTLLAQHQTLKGTMVSSDYIAQGSSGSNTSTKVVKPKVSRPTKTS